MTESFEVRRSERLVPRLSDVLNSKQRWRAGMGALAIVLTIFLVAFFGFLVVSSFNSYSGTFFFGLLSTDGEWFRYCFYGVFVIGEILLFVSGYFFRSWKECQEPTAEEAMARDARAPILYLRPFQADTFALATLETRSAAQKRDLAARFGLPGILFWGFLAGYGYGRKRRAEELIVEMLAPLGPVIAIGRPGERVPRMGASRIYVGDNWQEVVRDFMARCQLIVMFGGTTPGFAWEVTEAFRNAPFVPTILLLPYFSDPDEEPVALPDEVDRLAADDDEFELEAEEEPGAGGEAGLSPDSEEEVLDLRGDLEQFVDIFAAGSGLTVPADIRNIRAAYFPSPGEAVYVPDLGTEAEKNLHEQNPFLSALGRILHMDDSEWVEKTSIGIKERNEQTKQSMRVMKLIPLGLFLLGLLIALLTL